MVWSHLAIIICISNLSFKMLLFQISRLKKGQYHISLIFKISNLNDYLGTIKHLKTAMKGPHKNAPRYMKMASIIKVLTTVFLHIYEIMSPICENNLILLIGFFLPNFIFYIVSEMWFQIMWFLWKITF